MAIDKDEFSRPHGDLPVAPPFALPYLAPLATVTLSGDEPAIAVPGGLVASSPASQDPVQALTARLAGSITELGDSLAILRSVGGNDAALRQGEAQLQHMHQLYRALLTTNPFALALLRDQVQAVVASAAKATAEAREAVVQAGSAQETLAVINAAARDLANRAEDTLFRDRAFDDALRFTSAAEEAAYREREAERRALLEELDPNAPDYERQRLLIMCDQLRDTMDHGAAGDPRAQELLGEMDEKLQAQKAASVAAGEGPAAIEARDAELLSRLPRRPQFAGTTTDKAVGESVAAKPELETHHTTALEANGGGLDDSPTVDPVQQAASGLRAAGVSSPRPAEEVGVAALGKPGGSIALG